MDKTALITKVFDRAKENMMAVAERSNERNASYWLARAQEYEDLKNELLGITPNNGIPFEQETAQAKIRNSLSPFWTLVSLIELKGELEWGKNAQLIRNCVERCKENQPTILGLLRLTEDERD